MHQEFQYNGKAMGTQFDISIICDAQIIADQVASRAIEMIHTYEQKFSRFLPTSELSLLNDQKTMVVSKEFLDATIKTYELFTQTKGIFNPLVQVARLGYNKNFDDLTDVNDAEIDTDESPYDIDFSSTIIDQAASRITLQVGQKLDYGGFLKGYLAEILAKNIQASSPTITGVIVNLGGDIHTLGLDKDGNKFVFSIYNPILKNEDTHVVLYNQSLATSGIYKRHWIRQGTTRHHILDASGTHNPNNDIISASCIHPDGAISEAYAKVFLSIGPEQALKLLADNDGSFVVITNNGDIIKNI